MQEFLRAELERFGRTPVDRRLDSAGAQEKARDTDAHLCQADT